MSAKLEQILQTIHANNRLWLGRPQVDTLRYTFRMASLREPLQVRTEVLFRAPDWVYLSRSGSRGSRMALEHLDRALSIGIDFDTGLHLLWGDPARHAVALAGEERLRERDTHLLTVGGAGPALKVNVGTGLHGGIRLGSWGCALSKKSLWIDRDRGVPLREAGYRDEALVCEAHYEDYQRLSDGGWAPGRIEFTSTTTNQRWSLDFQVVDGRVWLLKEARHHEQDTLAAVAVVDEAASDVPLDIAEKESARLTAHYRGIGDEYIDAVLRLCETALDGYSEVFGIDVLRRYDPPHLHLFAEASPEGRVALWVDDAVPSIGWRVRGQQDLVPPGRGGPHHVYGFVHELGHLALLFADSPEWSQGLAHFLGSLLLPYVEERLGERAWPIPYDYVAVEGPSRLRRMIASPQPKSANAAAGVLGSIEEKHGRGVIGRAITELQGDRSPAVADFKEKLVEAAGDRAIVSLFEAHGF